jgi:hypothetical protein
LENGTPGARPPAFTKELKVWLSEEQDAWLEEEVLRRRQAGKVSEVEAAHGGNRNVNKGMVLREGLEILRAMPASE